MAEDTSGTQCLHLTIRDLYARERAPSDAYAAHLSTRDSLSLRVIPFAHGHSVALILVAR